VLVSLPVVAALFVLMAYLRRRGELTFNRTAVLGTLGMCMVSFSISISNGQEVWKALIGAVIVGGACGAAVFGLMKLAGMDKPRQ
jgi:hypothetical protein